MIYQLERPDQKIRPDLIIAIASLLFLLAAKPLFAQSANSFTTGTTSQGGTLSPTMTATPGPSNQTSSQQQSTYLNPPLSTPTITPGSSQSQRDASARQNRTNITPQFQPLPECRIEDTACIEQRNRMNQTNPQTAPTFTR